MTSVKGYVLIVYGRVQGVGFRWYAKRIAQERGVDGTVRNLSDGTVEIRCLCEEGVLKDFIEELKKGNTVFRHVDNVEINETDPDVLGVESGSGFRIIF